MKPLIENLYECSQVIRCRPVFIASEEDKTELEALHDAFADYLIAEWPVGQGDYARKINLGFAHSPEQFVFLGADDLRFWPGWIERAVAAWYETGACVIGTNDLGNERTIDGRGSTHTLVHRDYWDCGTADAEGMVLHEGYWHNFVDDEFVQTARARETFVAATDSIVEHLHPNWGKSLEDDVYRRGMAHWNEDRTLYNQRERLWK